MRRLIAVSLMAAAACVLLVGCATTTYSTRSNVRVHTNPAGTFIKVQEKGRGPKDKIHVKSKPSGTSVKVHAKVDY